MRSLVAALAIVASAAVAFGPDEAEARQRQKPGCTTPKFETPIAQVPVAPPVQYATPAPVPLQTFVSPPTFVETPAQTVTIPGQTLTFTTPDQTVTIPGTRIEVPGTVQTFQAPVVPYAVPYAQPPCPDDAPKRPLKTFLEQRKLKREKHLGMEEAAAVEPETSAACKGKKCKKRLRGWYDEPVLVA